MIRQVLFASRSKILLGKHYSPQCASCVTTTELVVPVNTADSTNNFASTSSVGVQQQRQQQQHCRTFSTDGGRNNQSLDDLFSNDVQDVPFSTNATSSSSSTICNDARLAMTVGMSEQQLQIVHLFEKEEEEDNNDVVPFSSYTSQPKRSTSKRNNSTSNDSNKDPREALSSNLLAASYLYWRTGTSTSKYPITQKTSIGSKFVKSSLARE